MTNSRDHILSQLSGKAPTEVPRWTLTSTYTGDLVSQFQQIAQAIGSQCAMFNDLEHLEQHILTTYPGVNFYAHMPGLTGRLTLEDVLQGQAEMVVILACWGVAENGAVWFDDSVLPHRVLPFYTEHLIAVLSSQHILTDMHEAYQKVPIDSEGFGLWVSGPSKTADIEQALVVGAQGPKTFLIAILP